MQLQILEQIFTEELFNIEKLKQAGVQVIERSLDPLVYYKGELLFAWIE